MCTRRCGGTLRQVAGDRRSEMAGPTAATPAHTRTRSRLIYIYRVHEFVHNNSRHLQPNTQQQQPPTQHLHLNIVHHIHIHSPHNIKMNKTTTLITFVMCLAFVSATPYLLPINPGSTDGVSSTSLAKSSLFDWQLAVATLGPCAVRIPHYHANANELLYVTSGTIVYINVEANNTFTRGEASPGFVVEQPQGVFHVVYNPNCSNATYTIAYDKANVTTYNVPYGIPVLGNFSLDATYVCLMMEDC